MGDEEKVNQSAEPSATPAAPSPQTLSIKAAVVAAEVVGTVPSSGKRRAFRELRRELAENDLASPGVQKMLLEELQIAEDKCEILESYVERYHDADKKAAILTEKLSAQRAFEILFDVAFGVGFLIIGLVPLYWSEKGPAGPIALGVGIVLAGGATVARVARR